MQEQLKEIENLEIKIKVSKAIEIVNQLGELPYGKVYNVLNFLISEIDQAKVGGLIKDIASKDGEICSESCESKPKED